MEQVTVKYSDYEDRLNKITDLVSEDNSKYMLSGTDKLQIDILVRLVVDDYVKDNILTGVVTIRMLGLLTIKLNGLTINDKKHFTYAYVIERN